jgi:pilus assembly protein Flp/PilA
MIEKLIVIARKLGSDNSGATAIEYGLIAAGIAIAIAAGVALAGENIAALFESVATAVNPKG